MSDPDLDPIMETILDSQVWLRRNNYENAAEAQRDLIKLEAAALADAHNIMGPTHVMERDGEIIGYASIGSIPMINIWLDSHKQRPRDAITALNMIENEAARMGYRVVAVPCWEKSPFRKLMERFGYKFLMESGWFTKKLRG